ncbi:MAG: alanine racemase [Opitutales bacterium]|nr:alanine racemase [Opitutales bacterium]
MISDPLLSVHIDAIKNNYQAIRTIGAVDVCPVLKADAYGLGAQAIAQALVSLGCSGVYVCTPSEGIAIREVCPTLPIYILNGITEGTKEVFKDYGLTPVINDLQQFALWERLVASYPTGCVISLETGLNRLGVPERDWSQLTADRLKQARALFVLTHFACAEPGITPDADIERKQNARQLAGYGRALSYFNLSGSINLDAYAVNAQRYPVAQVRTGSALLYGFNQSQSSIALSPTITLQAPIIQITSLTTEDFVGYGATYKVKQPIKSAVVGIGYAHGIPRSLSNCGKVFLTDGARWYTAPMIGRVSMNLINCDVSSVPQEALDKGVVYLLNEHYTLQDMGQDAHCLDAEISCRFNRLEVRYIP